MFTNIEDIERWLKENDINNYIINDDLTVDVNEGVSLYDKNLIEIPVQFGVVVQWFGCNKNKLTSLKGCPKIIKGDLNGNFGNFVCHDNLLTSLEYGPVIVENNYVCHNNNLTSLEYAPQQIKGIFGCKNNPLSSLEYLPRIEIDNIHSDFDKVYILEFFKNDRPEDLF